MKFKTMLCDPIIKNPLIVIPLKNSILLGVFMPSSGAFSVNFQTFQQIKDTINDDSLTLLTNDA